ncbi:MAG: tetratricopeptide repeat protein [Bacteroidetes bacterium]|nr:tetratricopeptide repeat protein [Bacteroidota bacterium]
MRLNIIHYSLFTIHLLFLVSCNHPNKSLHPETDLIKDTSATGLQTAMEGINKDLKANKEDAILYIKRARVYEAMHKTIPAVSDVEKAMKLDSLNAGWHVYLGGLYMTQGFIKWSIGEFKKAINLEPKNKTAALKLGEVFYFLKNRPESFKYLNAAINIDQQLAEAYYYRGLNFRDMGMFDKAVLSFQTAIEADKNYFEAQLKLGDLFASKKNKLAAAYYRNALNLKPGDTRTLYARGSFYRDADSLKLAIKDFSEIIITEPENKDAHYSLGYCFYSLKDYQKGITHFTKALETDPKYAAAYYGRSLCYEALGKKKEAAADLERVNHFDPKFLK